MNIQQFWPDVLAQRADNGKTSAWRQDMNVGRKKDEHRNSTIHHSVEELETNV